MYVVKDGVKSPIPSYEIYQKNYANTPIATIPTSVTYPDGPVLRFTSGALLKGSSPTVYLVLDNGDLYSFKSAEEFQRFGYRFTLVTNISDTDLGAYPLSQIQSLRYHAASNFVKYARSATVYMIENKTKRAMTSPDVFFSYATDWNQVLTIPDDITYPDGAILTFPDGMLLKGTEPTVYLTSQGMLRPFTSAEAFLGFGYAWNQIKVVRDEDLNLEGQGTSL